MFISRLLRSGVIVGALAAGTLVPSAGATPAALHLSDPSAMISVGSNLWIANETSSSLTIVNATNGSLVQQVSAHQLGIGRPDSLVQIGTHVFVASVGGPISELTTAAIHVRTIHVTGCAVTATTVLQSVVNRLVEVCANGVIGIIDARTGRYLRTMSRGVTGLSEATAATHVGNDLFITNVTSAHTSDGVVEVNLASFKVVASITNATNASFGFNNPQGITSDGLNLWVSNETPSTVTEISLSNLSYVQSITTSNFQFSSPTVVMSTKASASAANAVYIVSNASTSSMVTRITSSGTTASMDWMMCNTNYAFQFNNPSALVIAGGNLWVANAGDNTIDQMDPVTGVWTATLS